MADNIDNADNFREKICLNKLDFLRLFKKVVNLYMKYKMVICVNLLIKFSIINCN